MSGLEPVVAGPLTAAPPSRPRSEGTGKILAVTGVLALATVVALFVGNGNLVVALAPALSFLLVWALWSLPLRAPMLVLFVLAWAVEAPGDAFASGLVQTPWRLLGDMLWGKLNLVLPVGGLVLTGFDLVAALLFAVIIHRHARHSQLDRVGWVNAPPPLATFAWMSVLAVAWMSLYGLALGGSFRFTLWQSTRWIYLPIVYLLMKQALRGPRDALLVGRLLLGVGLFRALEAIIFRISFPSIEVLPHATTHADSVLFATCLAILGAIVLELPGKRSYVLAALLAPFFLLAIRANNRRLVWAEIGLVAIGFWLLTPWRPLKRRVARLMVALSLPLLLYGAVGWGSDSPVFAPIRKVRSMIDPEVNFSTLWRDLENFNLVYTYSQNPVFGSGFGHPFIEKIKLPDVTATYELEPYVPHNSVLGLWAFGGLVGFSMIWAVFPVGIFFAARAYRWARGPQDRIAALGAMAAQICYLIQGYGDLGFGAWGPVFTLAVSYALVGKICVASGGWGPVPRETAAGSPEVVARSHRSAGELAAPDPAS